jgi:hypothetical protein
MTEDQILKTCRVIEENGHNLNSNPMQSVNPYFGLTHQYEIDK